MTDSGCRLYLITPPAIEATGFAEVLARTLDAGDVACVQLRLKGTGQDDIRRAVDILRPVVQSRDVALLLNDDPLLASDTGCDGVHIGQDDATVCEAREALGADAIIGVTCHNSRHLAMQASEAGADYVAFGSFFDTATKKPKTRAEVEILENWSEATTVPCVAIGGITVGNCPELVRAGADFLAVVGDVWDYAEGPEAAVRDFNTAIASVIASNRAT